MSLVLAGLFKTNGAWSPIQFHPNTCYIYITNQRWWVCMSQRIFSNQFMLLRLFCFSVSASLCGTLATFPIHDHVKETSSYNQTTLSIKYRSFHSNRLDALFQLCKCSKFLLSHSCTCYSVWRVIIDAYILRRAVIFTRWTLHCKPFDLREDDRERVCCKRHQLYAAAKVQQFEF